MSKINLHEVRRAEHYLDEALQIINWIPNTNAYEAKLLINQALGKLKNIENSCSVDAK